MDEQHHTLYQPGSYSLDNRIWLATVAIAVGRHHLATLGRWPGYAGPDAMDDPRWSPKVQLSGVAGELAALGYLEGRVGMGGYVLLHPDGPPAARRDIELTPAGGRSSVAVDVKASTCCEGYSYRISRHSLDCRTDCDFVVPVAHSIGGRTALVGRPLTKDEIHSWGTQPSENGRADRYILPWEEALPTVFGVTPEKGFWLTRPDPRIRDAVLGLQEYVTAHCTDLLAPMDPERGTIEERIDYYAQQARMAETRRRAA